jgi:F0F1-type ATP synthase alpha subunit
MLVWYFWTINRNQEGSIAKRTQRIASLKGEQMVGRVVNTLGFPIDGKDQLVVTYTKCLWKKSS